MNFLVDPDDASQSTLVVTNPPVVSLEETTVENTDETVMEVE